VVEEGRGERTMQVGGISNTNSKEQKETGGRNNLAEEELVFQLLEEERKARTKRIVAEKKINTEDCLVLGILRLNSEIGGLHGRMDDVERRIDDVGKNRNERIDETNERMDGTNARIDKTNEKIQVDNRPDLRDVGNDYGYPGNYITQDMPLLFAGYWREVVLEEKRR
jgi:hypothetical protein